MDHVIRTPLPRLVPRPDGVRLPGAAIFAHAARVDFDAAMIAGDFDQVVQPRRRLGPMFGYRAEGPGAGDVNLVRV